MNWFKQWMKDLGQALGAFLVAVLVGVGVVLYLLLCPFEMIRYHRTPYYKATKRKYKPFAVSTWNTDIYNHLAKKGVAFEYEYRKDCAYYVLNGQVLIPGFTADQVKQAEGMWYLELEDNEAT